jgi:tetratricopeptide (TPR) repeat protein
VEYSLLLSDILCEMGLHSKAADVGLKTLSYNETVADCYFQVSSNFVAIDEPRAALSILNTGLNAGIKPSESDFSRDTLTALLEKVNGMRDLVLITPESEYRAMLMWANTLMAKDELKLALQVLEMVPVSSKLSSLARVMETACHIALGNIDAAKELSEKSMQEENENPDACVNALKLALMDGDTKKIEEILDILDGLDVKNFTVYYRLCHTLLSAGMHKRGLEALNKYLTYDPYCVDSLLMKGLALYNSGETRKAKETMLFILDLDERNISARYYNKYFQDNEKMKKPLPYSPDLPDKITDKKLEGLARATFEMSDTAFEKWISNSDNEAFLYWFMQWMGGNTKNLFLLEAILEKDSVRAEDLVRENLASLNTPLLSKRELLETLIFFEPAPPVVLTVDYDMKLLNFKYPKGYSSHSHLLRTAFKKAFVTGAIFCTGFEDELLKIYKFAREKLKGKRLGADDADSAVALAAAMVSRLDDKYFLKPKAILHEVYGIDEEKVKEWQGLLDN